MRQEDRDQFMLSLLSEEPSSDPFLVGLSGGAESVGTLQGRSRVAAATDYLSAQLMVHMLETHGVPLMESAMIAAKYNLRVDLPGLQFELEMLRARSGVGPGKLNVEAELQELRYACEILNDKQRRPGRTVA